MEHLLVTLDNRGDLCYIVQRYTHNLAQQASVAINKELYGTESSKSKLETQDTSR